MELYDFLREALTPSDRERCGQRFMNLLCATNPDLYERITGSPIDPFYTDDRLWAAIEFIKVNWKSESV